MTTLYTPPDPQDITVCELVGREILKDVDGKDYPSYVAKNFHNADKLAQTVVEQGRQINLLQQMNNDLIRRIENLERK